MQSFAFAAVDRRGLVVDPVPRRRSQDGRESILDRHVGSQEQRWCLTPARRGIPRQHVAAGRFVQRVEPERNDRPHLGDEFEESSRIAFLQLELEFADRHLAAAGLDGPFVDGDLDPGGQAAAVGPLDEQRAAAELRLEDGLQFVGQDEAGQLQHLRIPERGELRLAVRDLDLPLATVVGRSGTTARRLQGLDVLAADMPHPEGNALVAEAVIGRVVVGVGQAPADHGAAGMLAEQGTPEQALDRVGREGELQLHLTGSIGRQEGLQALAGARAPARMTATIEVGGTSPTGGKHAGGYDGVQGSVGRGGPHARLPRPS